MAKIVQRMQLDGKKKKNFGRIQKTGNQKSEFTQIKVYTTVMKFDNELKSSHV